MYDNSTNLAGFTNNGTGRIIPAGFCPQLYRTAPAIDNNPQFIPEIINLALNIPTSIAAILGNLLVMLSVWNSPSLHSPSHGLLFGLAMADFGVGLVAQPAFIVYSIAKITIRLDVFCTSGIVVSSLSYGLCGISLLTLTAISFDRFLAIHLHLRYRTIVTTERVVYLLVAIWLVGISVAAVGPIMKDFHVVIVISAVVASFCICLIIFSYWRIFMAVRRHQRQIQNVNFPSSVDVAELKKSSVVRLLICCLFFLCYLPFVLVTVWYSATTGSPFAEQIAFELSSTIILTSSCLTPIVYCWRVRAMRSAFRQTLRKYCLLQCGNIPQC